MSYRSLPQEEAIQAAYDFARNFYEENGYFPHAKHWHVSMHGAPIGADRLYKIFGSYPGFKNYCFKRGMRIDNNTNRGWVLQIMKNAKLEGHFVTSLSAKSNISWAEAKDLLKSLGYSA